MSDELREKVQALRDAELRLEDDLVAARTELAEARAQEAAAVLNAVLADGSGTTTGKGAAAIVAEIAAKVAAIAEARSRRVSAIRAVWAAEADDLRSQAVAAHTEADAHAAKVKELLAALTALEGVPFVADPRVFEDAGMMGGMRVVDPSRYLRPRGDVMRDLADGLDSQAAQIEVRQVNRNGDVNAGNRDDLLALLRGWDAMNFGPALHTVSDWLSREEAAIKAKIDRLVAKYGEAEGKRIEYTYSVTWRDGELVESESSISAFRLRPYTLKGSGRVVDEREAVA